MRILHTEASKGWGGQEIRILTEAAGMRARGHHVELACPADARIHREAERYGVKAYALPIGRKNPSGLLALRAFLRANAYDVVNAHSSTDAWLVALASRGWKAPPLVRTRHISAAVPDNRATRWLYRNASAHVVTTGEALREQLVRHNGLASAHVTSVPTGIDAERFPPADPALRNERRRDLGLPLERPLVGIVATLRSWKGHRFLLEAMRELASIEAHLAIVGDGPQRSALEAQARDLGIEHAVTFAGNRDDVAPWLQSFDAFALPSYANEGVPQALLQAMFTALPCVTTNAGAISEIAIDRETALVVARENPAALAAALHEVLSDAEEAARLGANARALVLERHGLDRMLERMENVFEAVIAR
jgi:glycosyltransferase involved in cell wall biosynthesis